jgi:hypothetical protein
VQALSGAVGDALVTVEQALQTNPDELIFRPDLLRIRGQLRIQRDSNDSVHIKLAELDYRQAIASARGIGAKSLELRASTSLAQLLVNKGRREQARTILMDIYRSFTEGFDTPDLKDTKALLDELSV